MAQVRTRRANGTEHPFASLPRSIAAALALTALVLSLTTSAPAFAADPAPADAGTVTSNGAVHPYLLSTPSSYQPDQPVPLVVVVHGCQTTAQQERELTAYDELAEREGFAVLYPEVAELGRNLPGPLNHCWRFFDPTSYVRGLGDVAAIAGMTRQVMADLAIDEERVFVVGVSAGGLMAAAAAAAYPDLYAAVGIVTAAGYLDAPCFATGTGIPVELGAQLAFAQMGPRARVVPAIVIGSDADMAFPATCTNKAVAQSLRTNNLVLSGTQDAPLALTPATERTDQVPDGRSYSVSTFVDRAGCLVAERWLIRGMPHAWPGGVDYGGYTDTGAPDGAAATWSFLERYRRSTTSLPCAEHALPTASPSAPSADLGSDPVPPADEANSVEGVPAGLASGEGSAELPATGGGDAVIVPALLAMLAIAFGRLGRRAGWR
jgi:poly(3-hydroxybutyrate) depolymerase